MKNILKSISFFTALLLLASIHAFSEPAAAADRAFDPFKPLLSGKGGDCGDSGGAGADGPVEKKDAAALKDAPQENLQLVGIVRNTAGAVALVRDETGGERILFIGDVTGTNSGVVSEILENRIVINEKVEISNGRYIFRKRELPMAGGDEGR